VTADFNLFSVGGEILFAWDAWVFGGEIDEDMRRLIDEGWREVIWVKNAREASF